MKSNGQNVKVRSARVSHICEIRSLTSFNRKCIVLVNNINDWNVWVCDIALTRISIQFTKWHNTRYFTKSNLHFNLQLFYGERINLSCYGNVYVKSTQKCKAIYRMLQNNWEFLSWNGASLGVFRCTSSTLRAHLLRNVYVHTKTSLKCRKWTFFSSIYAKQ
jgi:hypothetical protein